MKKIKPHSIKLHLKNMDAKKLLRNKRVIEEINRHKWLESEIAGYDIGFEAAAEDWLKKHAGVWVAYHANKKLKSLPAARQFRPRRGHLVKKAKKRPVKSVSRKAKRSVK